jgi:hypothetical protein
MPTRKQRRRRAKDLRHEWEEVYVDAEGRELAPDEVEELLPKAAERNGRAQAPAPAAPKRAQPVRGRAARGVQPPSWQRVLKRALIFAPLMYVFIALTSSDMTTAQEILTTVWLLLIFIPFSYLMDSFTYRLWKKRLANADQPSATKRR